MVETVGHDIGFTLWTKCESCGDQIVVFGSESEFAKTIGQQERSELESILKNEGWKYLGNESWLCDRCATPALDELDARRTPKPEAPSKSVGNYPDFGS